MSHIPVVDFKDYGLMHQSAKEARRNNEGVNRIAHELIQAFKTVGFAYLKNTGLRSDKLDAVFRAQDTFFTLPKDVKAKYRPRDVDLCGWVGMNEERLDRDGLSDLKEGFSILPSAFTPWPTDEVPDFKDAVLSFHSHCTKLAYRVLDIISHGLQLKTSTYLRSFHEISSGRAPCYMRLMYYPPLEETQIQPGQIRLGEHTDFGSITLLFQDQAGGLEVQCRDGIYRPATPIPDTVLINIGDLMQRWTSDALVSNSHRVVLPDENERAKARRSVVYFVRPNNDSVIECFDGSNKYPPVITAEYVNAKIRDLYR